MLKLIIEGDFENIGAARDFLYEIGHEMNLGKKQGEGWVLSDCENDQEGTQNDDTEGSEAEDGKLIGKELPNDPSDVKEPTVPAEGTETEPRTPDKASSDASVDKVQAAKKGDKNAPMPWEKANKNKK